MSTRVRNDLQMAKLQCDKQTPCLLGLGIICKWQNCKLYENYANGKIYQNYMKMKMQALCWTVTKGDKQTHVY